MTLTVGLDIEIQLRTGLLKQASYLAIQASDQVMGCAGKLITSSDRRLSRSREIRQAYLKGTRDRQKAAPSIEDSRTSSIPFPGR